MSRGAALFHLEGPVLFGQAAITRYSLQISIFSLWSLIFGWVVQLPQTVVAAVDGVVMCAPGDPYRPLADAIAGQTGYSLVDQPEAALACDPGFLIWVTAPDRLSDRDLVAYAMAVRDRSSSVSLGFITGRTLEQARAFWHRGSKVFGTRFAIANGAFATAGRFSNRLVTINGNERNVESLTLAGFQDALVTADYVAFTGHGTPTRLRLDPTTDLRAGDVPTLSGLVLTSGSCNSFRFWQGDSLLLALIEKGAAAYTGFAYSPNAGYVLGAYDDLALRHTWPGFPIGHAIQVQNHGCRQGFANFPFYLLAGDPRQSLRRDRPYEVIEDRTFGSDRVLRLRGAPQGVLPIRIPGGADYRFVHIPKVATAGAGDWFYHSRLQMANIGADKYLLVLQRGGEITVQLRPEAPLWWWGAACLAALDSTLIFSMCHSGDLFQSVLGGITWMFIAWAMRRCRDPGAIWTPLVLGLAVALGHGLYMGLRLKHVVVTSKPLEFTWLAIVGTFLTASAGGWLCYNGKRAMVRLFGLLLPVSGFLVAAVFLTIMLGFMGWMFTQRIGAPTWNYHLVWPHLITLLLVLPSWALLVRIARPRHPSFELDLTGRKGVVPDLTT